MLIIGLSLLIFSFLGYSGWLKNKLNIDTAFIPFIYATTYTSTIYIFALLDIMKVWILLFNLVGVLLFILCIKNNISFKTLLPEYLFLFLFILFLIIYLTGRRSLAYDDFSHWGVISRLLIEEDGLNTANDFNIHYNTYPQATAYFSYGLVELMGYTESRILISNGILLFVSFFTFLSVLKKNIIDIILLLVSTYFVLIYNIRLFALSVDSILGIIPFAILAYRIYYKNCNDIKILFLIPMFVTLTLVKHSALLFVLFIFIVELLIDENMKIKLKWNTLSIVTSILTFVSWKIHVSMEFPQHTKHDLRFSSYKSIFSEKTTEDMINAIYSIIIEILHDKVFWIFIAILIIFYITKNKDKVIGKIIICSLVFYFIYQVGLYLTYVLSMSTSELKRLASYDRYIRSLHIFIILIGIYVLLKKYYKFYYMKLLLIIFLFFSTYTAKPVIQITEEQEEMRDLLDLKKKELGNVRNKNILVIFNKDDTSRYYTRMSMYIFDRANVTTTSEESDAIIDYDNFDIIVREKDIR